MLLPEMLVVDLLVPAAAWPWRLANDAAHVYGALWAVGLYATFRDRPHRVEGDLVRFSCGALRAVVVIALAWDVTEPTRQNAPGPRRLVVSAERPHELVRALAAT